MAKLKSVKISLKSWNNVIIGNLTKRIIDAQHTLTRIQVEISANGFSKSLFNKDL